MFGNPKWFVSLLSLTCTIGLVCSARAELIIMPNAGDTTIAFESEIGEIDNSFGDPAKGWIVDGVTTPAPPPGASGGSYVVNTEQTTVEATVPNNSLTYFIDFAKTGIYNIYTRAAFTTEDFDDGRDGVGNNDSYFWDAGALGDGTYARINRVGTGWVDNGGTQAQGDLLDTQWRWFSDVTTSRGGPANLTITTTGIAAFTIGSREDGFMLDRIVLVHEDEAATIEGTFFDGLANTTTAQGSPPKLTIDRDTGAVTFTSGSAIDFLGYSITSSVGSLDQTGWKSIADNYDADGPNTVDGGTLIGTVDPDDVWTILSNPTSHTDLSESELAGGDGGTISPGSPIVLSSLDAWMQYHVEDVTMELLKADGGVISILVDYTGNNGQQFAKGDFNFDGDIDPGDYEIFLAGLKTDLSEMSVIEAYKNGGDMNENLVNDHDDVMLFRDAYGPAAFDAMIAAAVPEPSTAWLLVGACALLLSWRGKGSEISLQRPSGRLLFRPWRKQMNKVSRVFVIVLMLGVSAQAAPPTVGSPLYFHVDADSLGLTDGAAVTAWADNTTNGNDLAGTATYATNWQNGHAALLFNGTSDIMFDHTLAGYDNMGGTPNTSSITAFVVGQYVSGTEFTRYLLSGQNATLPSNDNRLRIATGGGDWRHRVGDGGNKDAGVADTDLHVFSVVSGQSGNATTMWVDGTFLRNGDHGVTANCQDLNRINVGAMDNGTVQGPSNAYIAEVLIYDGALTDTDIESVNDYLTDRYFAPEPVLTLQVNTDTGAMAIVNDSGIDITMNYYEITSISGSLDPDGWLSLDEQDFDAVDGDDPGSIGGDSPLEGWDEAGGSDAFDLTEQFFLGSSTLSDQQTVGLGNGFNESGTQDLQFWYDPGPQFGALTQGLIVEVTGGVNGDFDNSGKVEQGDLDLVLLNWGQAAPPEWENEIPSGPVGNTELDLVRTAWGNTSSAPASQSVPEPATGLLVLIGIVLTNVLSVARRRGAAVRT